MLLVGGTALKALNSDKKITPNDLGFDRFIPETEFVQFNTRFENRMNQSGNKPDKGHQYFWRDDIQFVIDHPETNEVAFIYVTNQGGQKLRSAMVGRSTGGFYSGPIFVSTRSSLQHDILPLPDIKTLDNGITAYFNRLSPKYPRNPRRDKGVYHNKSVIGQWLNDPRLVTGNIIRVYFGIDEKYHNPELQNVMLIDDESFEKPRPTTMYAFDKGTGCCP